MERRTTTLLHSSLVTAWHQPRDLASNDELLRWLAGDSEPPREGGYEFAGFELHAHPDLVDRLIDSVDGLDISLVAAFGIPCVAHHNGTIVAFARGTSRIFIRGRSPDPIPGPPVLVAIGAASTHSSRSIGLPCRSRTARLIRPRTSELFFSQSGA
jgi:hypothetical protein